MSLLLTRMQNFRAVSELDKWTNRPSKYGAFDVVWKQTQSPTGIISQDLQEKAFASQGNTLEVPVFDKRTVTIGNTRPAVTPDSENNSALDSITFATYTFGFTQVPSMFSNNEMSIQRDFNQKMNVHINQLLADLDSAALTMLETAKTQVVADDLIYTYATNVLTASQAQKLRIIADINPVMASNDYYDPMHVIGNPGLLSLFLEIQESGLYNDQNRVIQWADKELHFTNRLSNAASTAATGMVVNKDSVGLLFRPERDARFRHTSISGHRFDQVAIPGVPFPMGLYYYETVDDYNAIGGAATADLTRTLKQHWSFSVDVAFVPPYITTPASDAGPVLKFNISDS